MSDDATRAAEAASRGLDLAPANADLLIGRAVAETALNRFAAATDDLTAALAIDRRRPEAFVLRAAAWRQRGDLGRAQDDVDRALLMDPDNAEALLERGILRQRHEDAAGARRDWERAIELAPGQATADLAEQNLALLQAGPTGR